jgi:hypothetical protein
MRAKERGRWEIAANHNVGLPGALTGKRPRETSLDSQATQLLRANEMTRWVKRVGWAVLACRLHPRLRTYGCDAAKRRFGPQADVPCTVRFSGVNVAPASFPVQRGQSRTNPY